VHNRKYSVRTCSQVLTLPYFCMLKTSKFYNPRNTNAGRSLLQTLSHIIIQWLRNAHMITDTMTSCNTRIIYDINRNHPNTAKNKNSYSIISPKQENAVFLDLRNQELWCYHNNHTVRTKQLCQRRICMHIYDTHTRLILTYDNRNHKCFWKKKIICKATKHIREWE